MQNIFEKSLDIESINFIQIIKNGDPVSSRKRFNFKKNSFLIWRDFLEELTKTLQVKNNFVKEIRDLPQGVNIRSLDDIKPTKTYVAIMNNENFSKYDYSESNDSSDPSNSIMKPNILNNKTRKISQNICMKNVDIKVYRNGDSCSRPVHIKIQPFNVYKMSNLMKTINDQLIQQSRSPIKRLFKLNGEEIRDITEMENRKHYVVSNNEKFVNVKYGTELPPIKVNKMLINRESQVKQSHAEKYVAEIIENLTHRMKIKSEKFRTENEKTFYNELFAYIEMNVIGRDFVFKSPFGERLAIYCDYTASGKPLMFIEEFIRDVVFHQYSNTHTTNTAISMQTSMFREEARRIIRNSCNAQENDVVLFVGNGSTGAIHKLVYNVSHSKPPIIVTGPFEHHSNLLPWRKIAHSTYRIKINAQNGEMDIEDLKSVLNSIHEVCRTEQRQLIGVFSAASNITGILTDVDLVSSIIHEYDGVVFWDYASGAPYISIDMNPVVKGENHNKVYKDAVYFSMHKFVGGPQSPGILIAKRNLFHAGERDPHGAGGGTVFFVGRENHLFLKEIEEREEGGTPDIIGAIRAGLTFQLKDTLTAEVILKREDYLVKYAESKFKTAKNLIIIGGFKTHRIPIFSFVIRHEIARNEFLFLHHHFICSLLNDLFGIQSRSGCACAGPYGMDLLGIDEDLAAKYSNLLVGKDMNELEKMSCIPDFPKRDIFKPGFVRINIPYFMPQIEVDFVLDAIIFVAEHGYKFLTQYTFEPKASEWRHVNFEETKQIKKLGNISYNNGFMDWKNLKSNSKIDYPASFAAVMSEAYKKLNQIIKNPKYISDESKLFDESTYGFRWFLLPSEVVTILWNGPQVAKQSKALFTPGTLVPSFPENYERETVRKENVTKGNLKARDNYSRFPKLITNPLCNACEQRNHF